MTALLETLRANAGFMIAMTLLLGCTLVLAAVGAIMHAAGALLKPLVMIGIFFALVINPQLIGHMVMAVVPDPASTGAEEPGAEWTWKNSMQDARVAYAPVTPNAEWVRLGISEAGANDLGGSVPQF